MNNTKLNHGYVLRIHLHFRNEVQTVNELRYFGPFINPIVAVDKFKELTKLKPIIPQEHFRNGMLRPVLGHKYQVNLSKKGIVAISIVTLETELQLANLKNPKD